MENKDLLIFIPTYKERENVRLIVEGLRYNLGPVPILFCDDDSPDGTYEAIRELAAEDSNISVIRRPGKLGIGSAHKDGIREAVRRGYRRLLTMDCDLTHQPSDCVRFVAYERGDVVIGSRFVDREALSDWNIIRKCLTKAGHLATSWLLKLPYDATGALRLYHLDRIGDAWLSQVASDGYAFFFESLMVLDARGAVIEELSIRLPKRTYGSSKMTLREIIRSVSTLLYLAARRRELPRS
jgi:glycosyltransferase involved in cell wall biosynthesis